MRSRRLTTLFFIVCVSILLMCTLCGGAQAGAIETIPVEDKGVFFPFLGVHTFPSEVQVSFGMFGPSITVTLWNSEAVNMGGVGPAVRVFNVYPETLHVSQVPAFDPDDPIDFFFFMAVDTDTTVTIPAAGLGPLPGNWTVQQASMTGTSGTQYAAQITPISDLANLPVSSTNLVAIDWDLSALSQTTGNFFLAQVTFPNAYEIYPPVTPALRREAIIVLAVLLAGIAVIVIRRKRRQLA